MYDFHVHSRYSSDSDSTMLSMAKAAKSSNLDGICFTDHVDLDYGSSHIDYEFSYNDYVNELNSLRASFPKNFEIFTGVEIGMQPHLSAKNTAFLKNKSFDFIIGSIHIVTGEDMYDGSYLAGITDNEGIMNYFKDMLQCIDNYSEFDVLGHLDVVRRYLNGSESFLFNLYEEQIHNVLSKLINSYRGIEVNTSGLRYGLSSYHPLPDILRLYRSLGGEIVTIGSDSHNPGTLGYELKNVLSLLSDLGFKYYTTFKDRKPVFKKI